MDRDGQSRGGLDAPSWHRLLAQMSVPAPPRADLEPILSTLVAVGAPLWEWEPVEKLPLAEAFVLALRRSHYDATILRALPVVLARTWTRLDWKQLLSRGRDAGEERALGMLLDVTASLTGNNELRARADELRGAVTGDPVPYAARTSRYGAELARSRTQEWARRWGFLLNMQDDAFRSVLEKHDATLWP